MFILGHVGITFFLAYMLALSPIFAAIGVLIPDLIDKPIQMLGLTPSGRFIGHTLLGIFLSFGITYLLTRKKIIAASIGFGYFLHLLEDLPYFIPWFYPFVDYNFPIRAFRFEYTIFTLIFDTIGVILLLYVYKTDSYFRNNLLYYFNSMKIKFISYFQKYLKQE